MLCIRCYVLDVTHYMLYIRFHRYISKADTNSSKFFVSVHKSVCLCSKIKISWYIFYIFLHKILLAVGCAISIT